MGFLGCLASINSEDKIMRHRTNSLIAICDSGKEKAMDFEWNGINKAKAILQHFYVMFKKRAGVFYWV